MTAIPAMRSTKDAVLADPALRRALTDVARRKVPPSEVDDVVQATLIDALASTNAPDDPEAMKRWMFGILRHKVADLHRRTRREGPEVPEIAADSAPHDARDLLSWAERELPGGDHDKETLDWMLREGEGEKLESIATSEQVPAPRVRQRVTRMRQHFRARWAAQLAAAALVITAALIVAWFGLRPKEPEIVRDHTPDAGPDRATELRRAALERCAVEDWDGCLRGLDQARELDPTGETREDVKNARERAAAAKTPPPPPSASTPPPSPTTPTNVPPAPTMAPPAPAPAPIGSSSAAPMMKEAPLSKDAKPGPAKKPSKSSIDSDGPMSGQGKK